MKNHCTTMPNSGSHRSRERSNRFGHHRQQYSRLVVLKVTSDISIVLECHKNARPPSSGDDLLSRNFISARSPEALVVATQPSLRSDVINHDSFRSEVLFVFVSLGKKYCSWHTIDAQQIGRTGNSRYSTSAQTRKEG